MIMEMFITQIMLQVGESINHTIQMAMVYMYMSL